MTRPEGRSGVAEPREDVRVAMALNGGVSLAVWMGGCAVELDSARRAHLGREDLAYTGYAPESDGTTRWRRVYNGICAAFDRRLTLDILSGASAGGLNGALLAAAMVSGRRLHPRFIRQSWLDLGDLSLLLRDPAELEPASLMDGDLFHSELLRTFRAVRGVTDDSEPGDDDDADAFAHALAAAALPSVQCEGDRGFVIPDLDVTMTDVVGVELTFPDEWGGELIAREHGPRFKFRDAKHFTSEALAAAARTSASFPIAFEPWKLEGEDARRAGLDASTYGIDGGLLDNAPIRAALQRIPFRRANTRVRRFACYVNADPTQPGPPGKGEPPRVEDVLGYVINLPRTAPFVDQLYALREAVNRPLFTQAVVWELLKMDLDALEATALALLPAYRRRRTAHSIEELVDDPAQALKVRSAIKVEGEELPWIPEETDLTHAPDSWSWGVRPAQRVLYLLLDLLRDGLAAIDDEGDGAAARDSLLELRGEIDDGIARLEQLLEVFSAALGPLLASGQIKAAVSIAELLQPLLYEEVRNAAEAARQFESAGGEPFAPLFPEGTDDDPLAPFFRRVLAIEVVRRALSDDVDVDSAQPLRFVQLTPSAPTPILEPNPFTQRQKPAQARDKLLGIGLSRFAGFYRRAWRANDFMWGRLDGAARAVNLLLDGVPTGADIDRRASPSRTLVDAVLGQEADETERWLAQEALADLQPPLAPSPDDGLLPTTELRHRLHRAISSELTNVPIFADANQLSFTRAVCIRAAQLEVMRDELPAVIAEAKADGELGSSGLPLDLGEGTLRKQIENLRTGQKLPQRLTGPGEPVSDLGLGTIGRATRVGISMLEGVAAPLTKVLAVVRVPALAASGIVARGRLPRLAMAAAFIAAAIYLTSRIVTADETQAPFTDVWSLPVLLSLVGALIVITTILVPALQSGYGIDRPLNAGRAAALALSGGPVAVILALCSKGGGLDLQGVLLAPGAENPPETIVVFALFAATGLALARLPLPSNARRRLRWPRGGACLYVLAIVAATALTIAAAFPLVDAIDKEWWRAVSAALTLLGAPLAAAWFLMPWRKSRN